MSEINERIAALEAQLAELKAEVAEQPDVDELASRRQMFKRLAIGAAGVATAGVVGSIVQAGPAAAANNDPILIGATTTGTLATAANHTGTTATAAFLFQSGTSFAPSASAFPCALAGWADGSANLPHGIYGFTNVTNGNALVGSGIGTGATGALLRGSRANVNLAPIVTTADAVAATHVLGDLISTIEGDLWFVTAAGTPGSLVKLAGPTTAGSLHLLGTPLRAYDSRVGAKLGPDSTTSIDLTTGKSAGVTSSAVPNGAKGALVTITATATGTSGYLTAYSNALTAVPDTSSVNFTAGQDIASTTVVAVDATSKIKITVGPGATLHVLVDVIGYYQ